MSLNRDCTVYIVSCSTGDTSPRDLCIMTLFEAGALVLAFPESS